MRTPNPTVYADLNAILRDLVTTTQAILDANFCGAYLQGSFAVGDADEYSDVDFVIVTHAEVSEGQVEGLRSMHARFPTLDVDWAKHLEGSYIPAAALRRPDPSHAPYLYVDNGSPHLEWSNHDNTAVVRWVLREYGIALDGPDPVSLVDVVSTDELRDEIRGTMRKHAEQLRDTPDTSWSAWLQPHVVLSYCRMLHTVSTGRVGSKLAAGQWALATLDSHWALLIQRALDDRPDPWLRVHRPADHMAITQTRELIDYALLRAETAAL